jgi:hypothetical protein
VVVVAPSRNLALSQSFDRPGQLPAALPGVTVHSVPHGSFVESGCSVAGLLVAWFEAIFGNVAMNAEFSDLGSCECDDAESRAEDLSHPQPGSHDRAR